MNARGQAHREPPAATSATLTPGDMPVILLASQRYRTALAERPVRMPSAGYALHRR
jgi:hypothetical protein